MVTDADRLAMALDVFNRRGLEDALDFFLPDVVWMAPPEWPDQAVYEGYDGLRALEQIWRSNFDGYRIDLHEAEMVEGRVVARLTQHGAIKGTEEVIEQRLSWLLSFDDGRIRHVLSYFSWEEAMEAARS
jgi:ketosteroid isomerase-like protein